MSDPRPRLSGFCTGPIGARPQCARCVAHGAVCECLGCAGLRAEQGMPTREVWDNKSGPEGAQTPESPALTAPLASPSREA